MPQALSQGFYCPHILDVKPEVNPFGMKELLVFTDLEMDKQLSENNNLILADYIKDNKSVKYFITEDEKNVYIQENGQCKLKEYIQGAD